MEFGPVFRALLRNKTRFWLIVVEVALTLAVVANCVNMIADQRGKIVRDTGIAVDEILVVESRPFSPEYQDDEYVEDAFERDLRMLRALPGVRSASAMSSIPLSGGGSATMRRPFESEVEPTTSPYFVVSGDILETLGVELIAGRRFTEEDFAYVDEEKAGEGEDEKDEPELRNVLVTQALADKLFPDGDALGNVIGPESRSRMETIVGIVDHMHGAWPLSSLVDRVMFYPGWPVSSRRASYVVRVEPGMLDNLYTTVETEMLRIDEGRIVSVESLAEVKRSMYSHLYALNKLLGGLSLLLVAVTSLGVIGLTSFSVTQRTKQIGTRRALGATRFAILRYFMIENWLITGIGLLIGTGLTYGVNFMLANLAEVPKIGWPLIATGMVVLWLVGLLAALAPALRGTLVPPVVATRSV